MKGRKVLVCPLNWGLGHATRCVPIIRRLLNEGNEVIVALDGFPLQFIKAQFPNIQTIEYKSYPVRYSKGKSQVLAMLFLLPKLVFYGIKEHRWLDKTIEDEFIDMVISDNRFGLWSRKVHSIYITHQVMIKMPLFLRIFEKIGYKIHKFIIEKYDECWIPDYASQKNLSGDLSHKYFLPFNARFIGTLSRFDKNNTIEENATYKIVVIISGVEPQRSIFENKMIEKYRNSLDKTAILQGLPSEIQNNQQHGNVELISHLSDEEFIALLKGCEEIICRTGYSTIMDLEVLGVLHKAVFYPTEGQTEQEYLAQFHTKKDKIKT